MGVLLNFLSLRGVFGSFDDAVFGAILIGVMLFAPQGLLRVPRLRGILFVGRASSLAFQRVVRGCTTYVRRSHG